MKKNNKKGAMKMTIDKFAKAIGTGKEYVLRRVKSGEIPSVIVKKPPNYILFYYDIDPSLVPQWKKVVSNRHLSPTSTNNPMDKREYLSKDTPLNKACRQLKELEKKGIKVSYGQAVAMGLIRG